MAMNEALLQKSRLAFGVAMVCGFFLIETYAADHIAPNPASRLIWAVLGATALVAVVAGLWLRRAAHRAGTDAGRPGGP